MVEFKLGRGGEAHTLVEAMTGRENLKLGLVSVSKKEVAFFGKADYMPSPHSLQ